MKERVIQQIESTSIPLQNPVSGAWSVYRSLLTEHKRQMLPILEDMTELLEDDVVQHCLIMLPIEVNSQLDFQVLFRGSSIPGSDMARFKFGELYSHHILPEFAEERLRELATTLTLKQPRFSKTLSARRSALDVVVYRGVFPAWSAEYKQHAVILAIAAA